MGYFRCRQCEVYGNSIEFAKQFLGWELKEALEALSIRDYTPFQPRNRPRKSIGPITQIKPPGELWDQHAQTLVQRAQSSLQNQTTTVSWLAKRGLPQAAQEQFRLGWIDNSFYVPRSDWGLEEDEQRKSLWFPRGLLIPHFEGSGVARMKVRRADWTPDDELPKYIIISGSQNGLMVVGSPKRALVVLVESELDALAINWAAWDFVCAIAIGGSLKSPDTKTDALARTSRNLVICPDRDEPGEKVWEKWKQLYPHARKLEVPKGKDIGEAIAEGVDIRELLRTCLR